METMNEKQVIKLVLQVLEKEKNNLAKEAADDALETETYAQKANLAAKQNGKDAAFANARYASSAASTARNAANSALIDIGDNVRSAADALSRAGAFRDKAAEQLRSAKIYYQNVEEICTK